LGVNAKGLSSSAISRCKRIWEQEHEAWDRRSLESKRYVYIWADGIYFNIRSDDARQCILVIIGVTGVGDTQKGHSILSVPDSFSQCSQCLSNA
jgi:transposase-like protein